MLGGTEMAKIRDYVRPSSLASYFGCGFNDPDTQFKIDTGQIEESFDDDSKWRMEMGSVLEDASLNLLEKKLNVVITNRNAEMLYSKDGAIKGIIDGECVLNGIPTIVENKVSNAKSYCFVDKKGYHIQCQAYMLMTGKSQCILGGLYQGELVYKIINRDEDLIKDIQEMANFVTSAMMGLVDFNEDYPTHLMEKWGDLKAPPLVIENVSDEAKEAFNRIASINNEMSNLKKEKDELTQLVLESFDNGVYQDNTCKVSIYETTREGGIDFNALSFDHPEIDYSKYKKAPTSFKQVRVTAKRK